MTGIVKEKLQGRIGKGKQRKTCKVELKKVSKGKPARQIMKRLVKENLQGRIGIG